MNDVFTAFGTDSAATGLVLATGSPEVYHCGVVADDAAGTHGGMAYVESSGEITNCVLEASGSELLAFAFSEFPAGAPAPTGVWLLNNDLWSNASATPLHLSRTDPEAGDM